MYHVWIAWNVIHFAIYHPLCLQWNKNKIWDNVGKINPLLAFNDEKNKQYLIEAFCRTWGQNQYQEQVKMITSIDTSAEEDKSLLVCGDWYSLLDV